jgi:hypothetical protein
MELVRKRRSPSEWPCSVCEETKTRSVCRDYRWVDGAIVTGDFEARAGGQVGLIE